MLPDSPSTQTCKPQRSLDHYTWCTSMGRAQLAFLPKGEIERILKSFTLKKRTPNTIYSKRKLISELEKTRELKYAETSVPFSNHSIVGTAVLI